MNRNSFIPGFASFLFIAFCHTTNSSLPADAPASPLKTNPKKLIEFGWDEPDTEFMRAHIQEMEKAPFDGVVFHVDTRSADGKSPKRRFTWEAWGTNAFTRAEFDLVIQDLKATRFNRFTDNFLRFNTTPAKIDWFDDYTTLLHNCLLAATVAREGGVKGLLFDIEQYEGELFDYSKQRDAKSKGWEVYAAKVRERGREVMRAFQQGYPGLRLLLTFGYSLPWIETGKGQKSLASAHYGLLAPFLDGMLEVAETNILFIDGNEAAYGYREFEKIPASYKMMREELLPIVRDPAKYLRQFSLGFGLWMDNNWRSKGWDLDDLSKNFYSPAAFEKSLRTALETTDEYVWIYTEQPRWWSKDGQTEKLPQPYADAVWRARKGLAPD